MENAKRRGKMALIAGGTSGVGKKTALDLAKKHVQVIILGRNKENGLRAKNQIIQESGNENVEFYPVDLCCLDEIKQFRRDLETKQGHIDILVSAAGVMFTDLRLTKEGYDQNFVINYLAHFWMINEMLPLLNNAEQGRVLLVGAVPFMINRSKVALPKLERSDKYSGLKVVAESLMARVLLTVALSEKLKDTSVTVNIFHPGYVTDSNYGADLPWVAKLLGGIAGTLLSKKNVPVGMNLALDPALAATSGRLFNDKKEMVALSPNYSQAMADELWRFSLSLYA